MSGIAGASADAAAILMKRATLATRERGNLRSRWDTRWGRKGYPEYELCFELRITDCRRGVGRELSSSWNGISGAGRTGRLRRNLGSES